MGELGLGQIILLIVFILVPVINFVIKQLRRPVGSETTEDEPVLETPRRAQATPESLPLTPSYTSRKEFHASQALTMETPLSRRRFFKRALLENAGDVRRGIIIMTILGPCRAFDPRD
jgi:hypothetical protein